jgi:hypothetical protein
MKKKKKKKKKKKNRLSTKPLISIDPTAKIVLPSGRTVYSKLWVKDLQKLLEERSATAIHRLAIDITDELLKDSPKDTGLSAYSWFSSIGAAPTGVAGLGSSKMDAVKAFRKSVKQGDARVNKRQFRSFTKTLKKDWEKGSKRKSFNIVNNVFYTDDLDNRSPFVEGAVNTGVAIAERKLKL